MIQNKLSLEHFRQYNFIFYEQFLFRNLLFIFDDQKIKYKLLAVNLFKDRSISPVLVDLDSMSNETLEDFYNEIYLKERSNYISEFDHMGLVQNLIKTELKFEDFAEKLTNIMIVNENQLFRYYDPRVLIHIFLLNYRNKYLKDNILKVWILSFQSIFEEWCINLWGGSIIFNKEDFGEFQDKSVYTTISIEYFELVNGQTKEIINNKKILTIHEAVEVIQALHISLEVADD